MKRFGVLIVLSFLSLTVPGQRTPLTAFKDSTLPKSGSGDLYNVNQSPNRFEVHIVHDTLNVIMNNDSTAPRTTFLAIRQGSLVGFNYGEASGFLVFTAKDGDNDTIFRGPVQHIFTCYGRIFFTSGMWYQATHYGQLYQLDTTGGKFQAKIFSSFDYPIRQCHVTRDTMYLVTYGTLYRMQYGKAVAVTALPFISTSMTTQGRFMYFGMRGGYARLDLKTLRFRYFVYKPQ